MQQNKRNDKFDVLVLISDPKKKKLIFRSKYNLEIENNEKIKVKANNKTLEDFEESNQNYCDLCNVFNVIINGFNKSREELRDFLDCPKDCSFPPKNTDFYV